MRKFRSSNPEHQVWEDWELLHVLGAETVTGNGAVEATLPDCQAVVCMLETTAFGTLVGDTFDCVVQTYFDGAWIDVCAFTQLLGNDADKAQIHIGKVTAALAEVMSEDVALAAAAVRNLIGQKWRCRWVMAAAGTYTFTVKICPMK